MKSSDDSIGLKVIYYLSAGYFALTVSMLAVFILSSTNYRIIFGIMGLFGLLLSPFILITLLFLIIKYKKFNAKYFTVFILNIIFLLNGIYGMLHVLDNFMSMG